MHVWLAFLGLKGRHRSIWIEGVKLGDQWGIRGGGYLKFHWVTGPSLCGLFVFV